MYLVRGHRQLHMRPRFGVVRSLLRVLEDGQAAKDVVDVAIDANSAMQNLREAIAGDMTGFLHHFQCQSCGKW